MSSNYNQAMAGLGGINSGFGQHLGSIGSAYEGQQIATNVSDLAKPYGHVCVRGPTVSELRRREGAILRELAEVRQLIADRDLPDIADFERSG